MTPNTMKYQSPNRLKLSNVRGLMSKLSEIQLMLTRDKPLLFLLTETWFTNRCPNGLLQTQGYQIVRRDRKGKREGRICVLFTNHFNGSIVLIFLPIKKTFGLNGFVKVVILLYVFRIDHRMSKWLRF